MAPLFFFWPAAGLHRLLLLASLLLAVATTLHAQAPAWQSLVPLLPAAGGTAQVTATAPDANGNVYLAGYFSGTISLGSLSLSSAGGNDAFVAKWSSTSGSFVWAQCMGGPADDQASTLAVRASGVYVAGYFTHQANFGNATFTTLGNTAVFLTKLTDAGPSVSVTWTQPILPTYGNVASAYALVVNGPTVFLEGRFVGPALTLGPLLVAGAGTVTSDIFLTRLTDNGPSGTFDWARQLGGAQYDTPGGLAVQGSSVYVAGYMGSAVSLGTTGGLVVSGPFVAKLADVGTAAVTLWAQSPTGTGGMAATALALVGNNLYLAGTLSGGAPLTFGTTTITGNNSDAFLAKLTDIGSSANYGWALNFTGSHYEMITALIANGTSLYLAGYAYGVVLPGGSPNASNNVLITKLTDAGPAPTVAWQQLATSLNIPSVRGLAYQGSTLYVAGWLPGATSFGSFTTTGSTASPSGFLASLTDGISLASSAPAPTLVLHVYPNPAHGTVQVVGAMAAVVLYNALGEVVRTFTTTDKPLDVSGLPASIYYLQSGKAGTRLVVE